MINSQAQIYMCQDAAGHKTFSQDPCGADAKIVQQQDIDGSITIDTEAPPERKAADLCHMIMKTLNIARQEARMNVDANALQARIYGYMRDRISNYLELEARHAGFDTAMRLQASKITQLGYATRYSVITDDDLAIAEHQCKVILEKDFSAGSPAGKGGKIKAGYM